MWAVAAAAVAMSVPAADAADNRAWSPTGTRYDRGDRATLAAQTFEPGSTVVFTMFLRAPIDLGSAVADETGLAQAVVTLPRNLASGAYTVRASGVGPEGAQHLDLAISIRPLGPPRWMVTSEQYGRFLIAVAAVLLVLIVAIMRRRRRRLAARG